jgi:hypothetical protein
MPWALQHAGDKNVSISRRKQPTGVISLRALPSGDKQPDRIGVLFSDEKTCSKYALVDGGAEPMRDQLHPSRAPCGDLCSEK